jgi:peptide/nickel transport system ATP-binding protein
MYAGKVVEEADVVTLFTKPKHPYTQRLMKSIPSLDSQEKRLYSIKGNVPIPGSLKGGCSFAPRCDYAMGICQQKVPRLEEVEPGHLSRCWIHQSTEEETKNETALG